MREGSIATIPPIANATAARTIEPERSRPPVALEELPGEALHTEFATAARGQAPRSPWRPVLF